METSQRINMGVRSHRIAISKPQSDWDSFSLTRVIPKGKRGVFPLPMKMKTTHHVEPRVEGTTHEGRIVEAPSPQQHILQRRGGPRKNKKARET
jgi:hypothetical protein